MLPHTHTCPPHTHAYTCIHTDIPTHSRHINCKKVCIHTPYCHLAAIQCLVCHYLGPHAYTQHTHTTTDIPHPSLAALDCSPVPCACCCCVPPAKDTLRFTARRFAVCAAAVPPIPSPRYASLCVCVCVCACPMMLLHTDAKTMPMQTHSPHHCMHP